MTSALVAGYVDSAIDQLRRLGLMSLPGKLPDRMRDPSAPPTSGGWIGWRPVPSTATDEDLDSLERETGLAFPPLYREFLQYQHFVGLTERGLRFEGHLCDGWQDTLRNAYFESWLPERIVKVGLLPFGNETLMDAGPVCFDTRRRGPDGDSPVVFWDHELVGTEHEVRPMFSSCRKMFECLSLVAATDFDFIHHDEDDDQSLLPQKREAMARFLALDPEGAGGPAATHWTSWGVRPSESPDGA
jgi:hypothetical protein